MQPVEQMWFPYLFPTGFGAYRRPSSRSTFTVEEYLRMRIRQGFSAFTRHSPYLLLLYSAELASQVARAPKLSARFRDESASLGLTRQGVRNLIAVEGVVLLLAGTAAGIGCGLLISRVLTTGIVSLAGFRIVPAFPVLLVAVAVLAAPLGGLIASFLPARRAARAAPVVAMKGGG